MRFYKNLLGQAKTLMPATQVTILRNGPVLTRTQQLDLIKTFTKEDVLMTLKSIENNKAPGVDGFTSCFLNQSWPIIGGGNYYCPSVL